MTQAIDFAIEKIHPNVLQYTSDQRDHAAITAGRRSRRSQLLEQPRPHGVPGRTTNTVFMIAESGQYLANGYMWIPKGTPHPVLAQIFVNWRLSDEVQFPDGELGPRAWAWAELKEGILGESYADLVPEWFAEDYFSYYPTVEQLETPVQVD